MAKKKATFEECMRLIPQAIEWVEKQDVQALSDFLLKNSNIPMYCVGSGGELISLYYASLLYSANQAMSVAMPPLTFASVSDATLKNSKILFASGGGYYTDSKYVIDRITEVNPKGIFGLTLYSHKENSLVKHFKKVTTNWAMYGTNNIEGFISNLLVIERMCLLYMAFTKDKELSSKLDLSLNPSTCFRYFWRRPTEKPLPLFKDFKNYIVLYSGWGEPVAKDFESKMVEAGYASVQLCDYRNFCHGRFIFLSNHLNDSVIVMIRTPRDKQFSHDLIIDGKDLREKNDLFPRDTAIVTIDTDYDSPIATIDLVIKESIFFVELNKSFGWDANNPKQKECKIDKRVPKSREFKGYGSLRGLNLNAEVNNGTLASVSRKTVILYDTKKTIEQIAKASGVGVDAVRKYIKEKHIDRRRDEKLEAYNLVKKCFIKNPSQSVKEIAQKTKLSINTVRQYLAMDSFTEKPMEGKIGLAIEDEDWIKFKADNKELLSIEHKEIKARFNQMLEAEAQRTKEFSKQWKPIRLENITFTLDEELYDTKEYNCWSFSKGGDEREGVLLEVGNMTNTFGVEFMGKQFLNSEALYQCAIFKNCLEGIKIQSKLVGHNNGLKLKREFVYNEKYSSARRSDFEQSEIDGNRRTRPLWCTEWMKLIVMLKTIENPEFRQILASIPKDAIIIEKAPKKNDLMWGCINDELEKEREQIAMLAVGLGMGKDRKPLYFINNVGQWRGLNFMGKCLTYIKYCIHHGIPVPIDTDMLNEAQIMWFGTTLNFSYSNSSELIIQAIGDNGIESEMRINTQIP